MTVQLLYGLQCHIQSKNTRQTEKKFIENLNVYEKPVTLRNILKFAVPTIAGVDGSWAVRICVLKIQKTAWVKVELFDNFNKKVYGMDMQNGCRNNRNQEERWPDHDKDEDTKGNRFFAFAVCGLFCVSVIVPPLFHKEAAGEEICYEEDTRQAAERVLCIDDNDAALIWRLRLVEAARERLVLSTYDFRADNSGRDMMAALHQAAERGETYRLSSMGCRGRSFYGAAGYFRRWLPIRMWKCGFITR